MKWSNKNSRGLTLIELMITLVVLTVLATIAYPLYTRQLSKSYRSEAQVALHLIASAEQRFHSLNGRYGSAADLGAEFTGAVSGLSDRDGDGSFDHYALTVTASTTGFSVTADSIGSQDGRDKDCDTLVINQLGIVSATAKAGGDANRCW